jgi:hypothetical protein
MQSTFIIPFCTLDDRGTLDNVYRLNFKNSGFNLKSDREFFLITFFSGYKIYRLRNNMSVKILINAL